MSLYWLFAATVALKTGYFRILLNGKALRTSSSFPSTKLLFSSLLATLLPQPYYFCAVSERAAATRPGRRSWGAIIIFTVANSLLETAVFKLVVDLGLSSVRFFTPSPPLPSSPPPPSPSSSSSSSLLSSSSLASFLLLSAYCGLVHALFWDKCAFPPHRPPLAAKAMGTSERTRSTRRTRAATEEARAIRQRSAMNRALLLFFPMTAAWHRLLLLSSSGDSRSSAALASVVALHAVADFSAACSLRLKGPWSLRSR